ncbi:hypothetical protein J1N35_002701 [Gossypium stocksii]|uniref:Reverse transcriptase domain-containing protein n=1 Tax=Gossypium stocksii TaxID=47602 RepID=A0A9D3WN54_9ROSI|nr:hypothetical protein J1N35_002701 [Gossypium stocksii]
MREQKETRLDLEERLYKLYGKDSSDAVLTEITEVQLGLNLETDKEELSWEQRAHVNRLQNEKILVFFHKVAIQRHNRSRIVGLEWEDGRWFSKNKEMLQLALRSDKEVLQLAKKDSRLTTCFFVDDCILFVDASGEGAHTVRNLILEYEQVLSQRVNFDKSLIYFGASMEPNVRETVTSILGVRVAINLEKYLGLPMMVERKKMWTFANFVDQFKKRFDG